jgi:hypothetical protein
MLAHVTVALMSQLHTGNAVLNFKLTRRCAIRSIRQERGDTLRRRKLFDMTLPRRICMVVVALLKV